MSGTWELRQWHSGMDDPPETLRLCAEPGRVVRGVELDERAGVDRAGGLRDTRIRWQPRQAADRLHSGSRAGTARAPASAAGSSEKAMSAPIGVATAWRVCSSRNVVGLFSIPHGGRAPAHTTSVSVGAHRFARHTSRKDPRVHRLSGQRADHRFSEVPWPHPRQSERTA
jgi:hypothetical protein